MKCLIVEDEPTARKLLETYLSDYGDCSVAAEGHKAVQVFQEALEQGQPYDLICLDVMMPEMDGQEVLKTIRQIEQEHERNDTDRVKVIMTTALSHLRHIRKAFKTGCEAYLVKPIRKEELLKKMRKFGLIESEVNK